MHLGTISIVRALLTWATSSVPAPVLVLETVLVAPPVDLFPAVTAAAVTVFVSPFVSCVLGVLGVMRVVCVVL